MPLTSRVARHVCVALVTALACSAPLAAQAPAENLILVTLDGLRWQDVFRGMDPRMAHKDHGGVKDLFALDREFRRETPEEARAALMPFLWNVVAVEGQIFGDPEKGARATIANQHKFSYPGYSELLCGFADPRIDSNDKVVNPNRTVLEHLHARPEFRGRIAVFSGWDVHPYMVAAERSALFVQSAWDLPTVATSPERLAWLRASYEQLPRYWPSFCFDALTFPAAKEYLLARQPRVLYLALGETDEWGHGRRYDLYLQMMRRNDAMLRELWETAQSLERYRGKTALLITVDHGRGRNEKDWTDHGAKVEGAEEVWMAVLSPNVPALGVREKVETKLAQVAATAAQLLGVDYAALEPRAAAPLPGVVR
ncbi:MAG: AP protein [Planctomycetes bacterium]|nr:AP protein [Planctomycetota bacterium]